MRIVEKKYLPKELDKVYDILISKGYRLERFPGELVKGHSIFERRKGGLRLGQIEHGEVTVNLYYRESKALDKLLLELDL